MTAPTDKRQRPQMRRPFERGCQTVSVILNPEDYRLLHELVLQSGTSMAQTMRNLIRKSARAKEKGK